VGLPVLDISNSRINSAAAQQFATTLSPTTGLRMLAIASNPVGNAGAAALFTSPHLAGLKVLDLSYCQVGDEALRELLENSPLADGLNLLNLTGSPASAEMKQAVKDRMGDRVRL
jgi:Ran GTPase-activating protein (RanGAP) involved in mRNA processing and transport